MELRIDDKTVLMWCPTHDAPVVMYDDDSYRCQWDDHCWGMDCHTEGNVPPVTLDKRFPIRKA